MKVIAKYKDYSFDKDNNVVISFTVDNRYIEQVVELEQTHDDKYIELKTSDRVAQKSARQNRAVWQLIRMIAEKIDGRSTKENMNQLYCQLVTIAGLSYDTHQSVYFDEEETKIINKGIKNEDGTWKQRPTKTPQQMLEEIYRVVEVREKRENEKGKSAILICYRGLSHYDKEETKQFIETILDYAARYDLNITLETEELRSLIR